MSTHSLLMIEDDVRLADMVSDYLGKNGLSVTHCADASSGLAHLQGSSALPDLLILDLMLPDMDGLDVCRRLRAMSGPAAQVPVLMLTAKGDPMDRVIGLEIGADDYLPKPFSHAQLTARVKSLLRRYRVYQGKSEPEEDEWLVRGPLRINRTYNEVEKNGQPIDLPELEYQMLLLMASHAGRIFSAQNLYESVWNEPYLYSSNGTVMVHIRKLRVKLEDDPQNLKLIQTVWGKGYRFG